MSAPVAEVACVHCGESVEWTYAWTHVRTGTIFCEVSGPVSAQPPKVDQRRGFLTTRGQNK